MSALNIIETKWVIMDKARTVIAKGSPRNRWLISVDDKQDKKRILYYSSEGMARNGFSTGFYTNANANHSWMEFDLEPVKVDFIIRESES